jgi:hypothetical protein
MFKPVVKNATVDKAPEATQFGYQNVMTTFGKGIKYTDIT